MSLQTVPHTTQPFTQSGCTAKIPTPTPASQERRQFVPFLYWSLVWPGRDANTLTTYPRRSGLSVTNTPIQICFIRTIARISNGCHRTRLAGVYHKSNKWLNAIKCVSGEAEILNKDETDKVTAKIDAKCDIHKVRLFIIHL